MYVSIYYFFNLCMYVCINFQLSTILCSIPIVYIYVCTEIDLFSYVCMCRGVAAGSGGRRRGG